MSDYETVGLSLNEEEDVQSTALKVFGKSANYFMRKCSELNICEEDISGMLQIGKEFGAGPVRMLNLYREGNPVSYIGFLYQWVENEKNAFMREKREGSFAGYPPSMRTIDNFVKLILDPSDGFSIAEQREIEDTLNDLVDMCEQTGRNYRSAFREAIRLAQKYDIDVRYVIEQEGLGSCYNHEEWN
jgi:hypothetical protein